MSTHCITSLRLILCCKVVTGRSLVKIRSSVIELEEYQGSKNISANHRVSRWQSYTVIELDLKAEQILCEDLISDGGETEVWCIFEYDTVMSDTKVSTCLSDVTSFIP
jgi:hypothetical protein